MNYIDRKPTAREQQFLDLYREGLTFKQIGAHLNISSGTVVSGLHRAAMKLQLTGIYQLRCLPPKSIATSTPARCIPAAPERS